jgi:hypothetical protein
LGVNPWDQTAPMGQTPPQTPAAPAPGYVGAGAHWPTPHAIAPAPEPDTQTTPLRQRRWLAALALYLLAPITAELLTGSTPPLQFVNPLSFLFLTALYGSGALLVRETVRRRGLGWWSVILLGAAYGVLEEGLVVTSWLNPYWPDLAYLNGYSRALGVNWYWALGLTAFHAIISVTLPITLVEAAFPTLAPLPWLGKRSYRLLLAWLGIVSILGLIGFGFLEFRAQGYHPSPLGWLIALVIALALVWLGTHPLSRLWRHAQGETTVPPSVSCRHAPPLGTLRFAGFGFTLLFFAALWGGPHLFQRPLLGAAALLATLALATWTVSRWSHRLDWSPRKRLALLTGVALFFVALAPFNEYVLKPASKDESGLMLVAVAALAGLIWLARSARITEQRRLGQP